MSKFIYLCIITIILFIKVALLENVRILSYNLYLRPPPIHDDWSDYKNKRVELIGDNVIPNYDIIAFEEAFGSLNFRKEKLIEYGKKYGLIYHYMDKPQSILKMRIDGGLLILSRYPIVEQDRIEYPRGCHSDWFSIKGALYVRLDLGDNKFINIFSTHLQASYEDYPQPNTKDPNVRMNQILLLSKFVHRKMKNHENEPCFLMGDFNVDAVRPPKSIEDLGWYTEKSELHDEELDVYAHSNEFIALVNILKGNLEGVPEEYMTKEITDELLAKNSELSTRLNVRELIYDFQVPKSHPWTMGNFRGTTGKYEIKSYDFIFEITPYKKCNNDYGEEVKCDDDKDYIIHDAQVVTYEVKGKKFKYLSDHFAVTTTLTI